MRRLLLFSLLLPIAVGTGCQQPTRPLTPQQQQMRASQQEMELENQQETEDDFLTAAAGVISAPFRYFSDLFGNRIDRLEGRTPAFYARMMDQGKTPDERRRGMTELVCKYEFARHRPYTIRYRQLAVSDPDYTVRAMAIRALSISRDTGATPIFVSALDDPDELVRMEAAKALANLPDPAAIGPLLRIVEGRRPLAAQQAGDNAVEAKDVRIAAANALRHYRTLDVARTLVSVLGERAFGVAWQSRRSLIAMTGRDMRYDQEAWLMYLAGSLNPFG